MSEAVILWLKLVQSPILERFFLCCSELQLQLYGYRAVLQRVVIQIAAAIWIVFLCVCLFNLALLHWLTAQSYKQYYCWMKLYWWGGLERMNTSWEVYIYFLLEYARTCSEKVELSFRLWFIYRLSVLSMIVSSGLCNLFLGSICSSWCSVVNPHS